MKRPSIPIIALAILVIVGSVASPAFALYESKTSLLDKYKSLVAAHPSQASYVTIGYSPKGTPILMFRLGNPSSAGVVLWDAELHGDEEAGAVTAYLFCVWLFSGDSRATHILAHNYILVIPEVDNLNSRVNENHVNLNRNFPVGWGTSGSSSSTSTEYRGPSAGSEPETKALINVYKNYKPKFYINTHTWGGPVIYYSSTASSTITTLKSRLATYSTTYDGNPTSTNSWRRSSGGGFAITTANSYGIPSFLWEIGPSGSHPSYSDVIDKHYKETRCLLIAISSMCESSTTPNPGDADGDGDVDISDIVLIAGGYNKPPWGTYTNCDIDGDGDIDIFDIVVAAGNYGQSW